MRLAIYDYTYFPPDVKEYVCKHTLMCLGLRCMASATAGKEADEVYEWHLKVLPCNARSQTFLTGCFGNGVSWVG